MNDFAGQPGGHTIIAGYGLPGRAVADELERRDMSYCVIELNATTVHRCEKRHVPIIEGDCTDPEVLKQAGIDTATCLIIMIPNESAALEATTQARRLNPTVRIMTRCHYISTGIEARARGADDVVVAEQVVAAEVSRKISAELDALSSTAPSLQTEQPKR